MSEVDLKEIFTPEFAASMGKAFGEAMGKQMAMAQKATVADPPPYNQIHGIGSLFGQVQVGIDREVVSAMAHWRGVGEILPQNPVRTVEHFLPFITGVEPTSSTERPTECGNCISGETEACIQHFPTAMVCRETKAIKLSRAIERLNNGDIDLDLLNDQLGSDSPWHPGWTPSNAGDIMQVYTAWALLYELPPLFMQAFGPMVYTGNPANNIGNSYREFRGLQLLVNTGHRDAFSNVTCPALDSDVKDFNYADIVTQADPSFYEVLEMAHYYIMTNAIQQRLDPCEWVVVMRPPLWQILSSVIPAQSIMAVLMNMAVPANQTAPIAVANEMRKERDQIRTAMTIPLNGQQVRVILDHGIPELNNANDAHLNPGEYASDVYILPITYLGNRPAMRLDYKDYRFITQEMQATDAMLGGFYKPSPDGRFNWSLVRDGPCFKIQAEMEPRIILRVPQLAARIQNVMYVPMQHTREPDHDSPYFYKGGISTRGVTSYYH
jgi:hypothetical protein